jgi:hypothetical protein
MYCTRCGREVPDILWQGKDHPVLSNSTMVMNIEDAPLSLNQAKVTVTIFVEKRNCSEVFKVVPTDLLKD